MRPDKVVITITRDGEKTEVFSGDKVLSSRGSKMISAGEAKGTEPGNVLDDLDEDYEDLAEAIDSTAFSVFDIASELYLIFDED